MRPTVSPGDLALEAQPALAETFAPFGKLLAEGDRSFLGKRGRVLATVDVRRVLPRRVEKLQRYPHAKRVLVPMGRTPMWLVVLPPGETPAGPPVVFLVPEGVGVLLKEGVWHAGPAPLAEVAVCELLETHGPADRLDRRPLRDLCGVEAVRVRMPEQPPAGMPALDLGGHGVVLLDAALHGRIRIGALALGDVRLDTTPPDLDAALVRTSEGLRAMWGHVTDLREIPGIAPARDLYRQWGLDPVRTVPAGEALLAHVLAGHDVPAADPLGRAMALCTLRHPAPLAVLDPQAVGHRMLVRVGSAEDGRLETGGKPLRLEGQPVLCDGEDRPLATPLGQDAAIRPGPRTTRILVVGWFPASADAAGAESALDGIARTLETHLGGVVEGRLVAG